MRGGHKVRKGKHKAQGMSKKRKLPNRSLPFSVEILSLVHTYWISCPKSHKTHFISSLIAFERANTEQTQAQSGSRAKAN